MSIVQRTTVGSWIFAAAVCLLASAAGCYVGWWSGTEHYNALDSAVGEEQEFNYAANDTLDLVKDALRGDGILFEVQPDNSIITNWQDADPNIKTGMLSSIMGNKPRYRYEIQVTSISSQRSRAIVNVRTEGIPDAQIAKYKAGNRFALFKEMHELAAKFPPASHTPNRGGVNFTLLPHEDLRALARRVTGSESNWQTIAKDNGLKSAADVTAFQSVWVRGSLLKQSAPESATSPPQ